MDAPDTDIGDVRDQASLPSVTGNDPSFRRINGKRTTQPAEPALGSPNDGLRLYIALVRAVENEETGAAPASSADDDDVVHRVHRDSARSQLGVRTFNRADRRYVAVPFLRIDEQYIAFWDIDFIVYGVNRQSVGSHQSRIRALDHPNRRFLAIRVASKSENSLSKLLRHYEFVMNLVVGDSVHRPPQHGLLPFQFPDRLR